MRTKVLLSSCFVCFMLLHLFLLTCSISFFLCFLRFSDAVSAVQNLDFLPTQSSTPSSVADKCKSLQSADSSLIRILPDVLQVYAWAVVKQYEENPTNPKPTQQIAELAALSRNVPPPFAIGKDVFRELTGLERRLL